MEKKNILQQISEWEWTPIILGFGSSFWAGTMDIVVGGVSAIFFVWLAMYKGFIQK